MTQAYFGRKSRKLVQGEDMKKRLELYRRGSLPVYWLFFFGFLAGVVIPNIMWKYEWHQKTAASLYLLAAFADNSLDKGEYFLQVLKMREFYIWAFAQGFFLLCPFFSLDFRVEL